MEVARTIVITLIAIPIFDFIFAGKLAALAPSVSYRYWPPSKLRLITLAFLAAAVALDGYYGLRPEWTLLISLFALIVYGAAIMADIERQRDGETERASRTPPRYSEVDADY